MPTFITTAKLRLREAANHSANILALIPKGTIVKGLEEINNDWYKVEYQNIQGYCDRNWLQ